MPHQRANSDFGAESAKKSKLKGNASIRLLSASA